MRLILALLLLIILPVTASFAADGPIRLVKAEARCVEMETAKLPANLRPDAKSQSTPSGLDEYLWKLSSSPSPDLQVLAKASLITEDGQEASFDNRKWVAEVSDVRATTRPTTHPFAGRQIVTVTAKPCGIGTLLRVRPRTSPDGWLSAEITFSHTSQTPPESYTWTPIPESNVRIEADLLRTGNLSVNTMQAARTGVPILLGGGASTDRSSYFLLRLTILEAEEVK